ncbi:S-layer homology domain-containing protein [Paenibacillus alvei]|uniref:S-layer glycoprotein n=1 Tax=Paenibacillus alvei TaxID=44250 RepID=A0A383RIW8_PAEAL|nr:S-layer homology domain-containing protein [Paenibacillus alvei]SYX86522.1 S-layer glycoprotein [Paenibacillus alvei]
MREMNYQTSTQQTKQTKQFRGGEKKVMKKRLALLLSVAMAFSMFANVAFGADAAKTTQEKFDALKTQGVFNGYPDGSAGLEKEMTRAEFAKVLVKLFGLKEIHGTYSYKDKNYGAKNWAAPFIEAVTAEGLMQGKDLTKKIFDFNGKITIEEASKTLVSALKLEPVKDAQNNASAWAKGYFQAAVDAGLFSKDTNPKANATRSQLVEAAYAADELVKGPKVASYKVIDSKNVEFTMTDKEVVKVTLEKALEANKETEVKFQYKGKDVTAKVTYAITAAQKIESVTADNLKEVVVKFDGSVDKKSAEKKDNYEVKDAKIDSVKLLDKNTVYVLLEEDSTMKNQKEIELKVKGVQNEDKSKTFDEKVKFTPIDVKTPEAKEIVGLGTKAFKVVFSEPVKKSGVYTTSNYKVDGKTVSASVKYVYPNIAIVSTDLPVGEHKVSISNVEDFSGLKIAPVEKTFTIAEDTAAPEVVSAKAKDPMELEIEFNETIKSIDKIYHGNSSNTGVVDIKDNVVTVKFSKDKALYLGENTIHIEGVTDYSNNKANRETKVNPSLDSERPEVEKVELKNNDHQIVITFNKDVERTSAENRDNYVLKNKDGKTFKHAGLNNDGKPYLAPKYDDKKKTVTIDLIERLDAGDYNLEVNGVRDTAYVNNTMLPFTKKITADDKANDSRAWTTYDSSEDHLFIQFPKAVKTDGDGDATVKAKYTVFGKSLNDDYETPVLVQPDTVRIDAKRGTFLDESGNVKKELAGYTNAVVANLIKDVDGDWIKTNDSYQITIKGLTEANVKFAENATAENREELKVKMTGKLNNVDVSDFEVSTVDGVKKPYTYSMDGFTLTLKFEGDNKLPTDLYGAKLKAVNNRTQDTFGNPIQKITIDVNGKIQPEATAMKVVSVTGATYAAEVTLNSAVYGADVNKYLDLFTLKAGDVKYDITNIVAGKDASEKEASKVIKVEFKLPANVTELKDGTTFRLEYKNSGDIKVLQDRSNNAVKEFTQYGSYNK